MDYDDAAPETASGVQIPCVGVDCIYSDMHIGMYKCRRRWAITQRHQSQVRFNTDRARLAVRVKISRGTPRSGVFPLSGISAFAFLAKFTGSCFCTDSLLHLNVVICECQKRLYIPLQQSTEPTTGGGCKASRPGAFPEINGGDVEPSQELWSGRLMGYQFI
jgi:hypothetical protein